MINAKVWIATSSFGLLAMTDMSLSLPAITVIASEAKQSIFLLANSPFYYYFHR